VVTGKTSLTDEAVQTIADLIQNKHVNMLTACKLAGVTYDVFMHQCIRDESKRPEWAEKIEKARAESEVYWIKFIQDCGNAKNTAGVKAAEHMLKAMNPRRYRETKKDQGPAVVFEVHTGGGEIREVVARPFKPQALPPGDEGELGGA